MTLAELRKLAEARTKGEWRHETSDGFVAVMAKEATGCDEIDEKYYTVCNMPGEYGGYSCNWGANPNAAFIAAMANHIDRLLDVVEAAYQAENNFKNIDDGLFTGLVPPEFALVSASLRALEAE